MVNSELKMLRWSVLLILLNSLISLIMGIALIAIYYFDLLYTLNENRIIEFADPLIGPITMPIVVLLAIISLILTILGIIILLRWRKKNMDNGQFKQDYMLLKGFGIGSLFLFPIGTFLGVEIIVFINQYGKETSEDKNSDEQFESKQDMIKSINNLLMAYGTFRIIQSLSLLTTYHMLYIIPYEHMGSENAPLIRTIWLLIMILSIYLMVLGIFAMVLGMFGKHKGMKLMSIQIIRRVFMILNVIMIPIGSIIATNIFKISKGLDNYVNEKENIL